jgi:hypothetical protein
MKLRTGNGARTVFVFPLSLTLTLVTASLAANYDFSEFCVIPVSPFRKLDYRTTIKPISIKEELKNEKDC